MKKLFLIVALLLSVRPLFGQATTGYHRINQVISRAPQSGVVANVVPYAKIAVTNTATGGTATIYSDPLLSSLITPALVTADASGNYSYYLPLNYCVTESITAIGQSTPIVLKNICINGSGNAITGIDFNNTPIVPNFGVVNFTVTSPLVGTVVGNTLDFACPTCGVAVGTGVSVNSGSVLGTLNINAAAPSPDTNYLALTPKISGSNMILEAPYATQSTYGVTESLILTTTGSSCSTATLSGNSLNIPPCSGGSGSSVTTTLRTNPSSLSGSLATYDPIAAITPVCDIRAYGAFINGTTPIDSAVQACINVVNSQYGASGTILLPCVRQNSTGAGCYLANSSTLTGPSAGMVKFELQGGLQVGSTLVGYGWGSWFGDAGGAPQQFQTGTVPATIYGPLCVGTLGTAITAPNTATNITPTFSGNVYGGGPACSITNLPVGSAFTIAELGSSTATATRVTDASVGLSQVTLTLASAHPRVPPGENVTVTGCSDSSVNIANIPVSASDYTKQTITYFVTTTSNTTATGCTVTGFDEDKFESARILASGTSSGVFNGVTYSAPGVGQVTIMTKHTHLSTDQWGEVAAGPTFNTFTPQTWADLTVEQCAGACFWAEGSTNLVMQNMATQAWPYLTSVATELTANYYSQLKNNYFQATLYGVTGTPSGGQPSYPSALLCDSDAAVGNYYSHSTSGCDRTTIDYIWITGNIKLTGDGVTPISGMPLVTYPHFEEAWGNVVSIDNRESIEAPNCLSLLNANTQDNISDENQPLVGYTDGNLPPTGCAQTNFATLYGNYLTNQYFNGNITDTETYQATRVFPPNGSASSGVYNEGNLLAGEVENEGASFSPQIAPFGSNTMTSYTVSAWSALCVTLGTCTVTAVVGPDGPSGKLIAAEMDSTTTSSNIILDTWTGATYPGDHFLEWSWVRPGENEAYTYGTIGGVFGAGNGFFLGSDDSNEFTPTQNVGSTTNTCAPGAFSTGLSGNGWGPEVAICTVSTGSSTSHGIHFYLSATNGGSGTAGNQYAEPGFVFIPGPNNPACTAAGTCNLTADQIELARRDQYHGFVPPGSPAGIAVTGELVSIPGFDDGSTIPGYLTASFPMSIISSSAAPTIFTSSTLSTQIDINNTHSGGKNWAVATVAAGYFTIEDLTDSVNPLQLSSTGITVMGGTKVLDRCSGGTLDGAYVAASSTQATACTTGGGSLVNSGITTQ